MNFEINEMWTWAQINAQINEKWSSVAFIGLVIVSCIGIIVNGLTMFVILSRRYLKNKSSIIPAIFFLSLSDFLICSFTLPIQAARFNLRDWPFGSKSLNCKIIAYINHLLFALSVGVITLIVINRAVALYSSNIATKYFSWRNTFFMVILIAIFEGIFLSMPFLTSWNQYGYVEETFSCTIIKDGRHLKVCTLLLNY